MADSNTVHVGMPNADATSFDVRLVKVETAVAGLFSALGEIKTGVEKITTQVSSKGQINWAALAIVAGITVPALGWAWGQIGGLQARIDTITAKFETALATTATEQKNALAAAVAEQRTQAGRFETRDEIDKVSGLQEKIADLKAQIVSGKVERLATDVVDLQAKIVPLSTHQELWATQHEANKALAAQVDENRRALADITAPRDTISRIYKRLDDIESLARPHGARPE